jgi:cystathionine gamma-synthase
MADSDDRAKVPSLPGRQWLPETRAVHAGLEIDPGTRAIAPNISMSVNNVLVPGDGAFSADGVEDLADLPFLYARWTNPTVRQLEKRLAALEATEEAIASATGLAAIAGVFFTFLKAGDHLIISDVCYAGASELACRILPDYGIEVTRVNLSRIEDIKAAIRPNTRLIHCESPCNPIIRLNDLGAVAAIAHERNILVSVDSTFATPASTQPVTFGVDLVIHSLTKFINGHGDALGGVVCGSKALIAKIRARAGVYLGAALSAQNAWLIMRGVDTLFARMHMISDTAVKVAEFLSTHHAVAKVIYPGLQSHPQHELAARQMALAGGMIAFQVKGDMNKVAQDLATRLRIIHYAFSLGHQRSIVVLLQTADMMRSTFHLEGRQLHDYREFAGDGIFRLSIGLEKHDDLIADLGQALRGSA